MFNDPCKNLPSPSYLLWEVQSSIVMNLFEQTNTTVYVKTLIDSVSPNSLFSNCLALLNFRYFIYIKCFDERLSSRLCCMQIFKNIFHLFIVYKLPSRVKSSSRVNLLATEGLKITVTTKQEPIKKNYFRNIAKSGFASNKEIWIRIVK